MTPQHRLAIQIMYECGLCPTDIFWSNDWAARPSLEEIKNVCEWEGERPHYRPPVQSDRVIEYRSERFTAQEWKEINRLSKNTISKRRRLGWGLSKAYGEPLRRRA